MSVKYARYQFTDDAVYKLVNGLQVPFAPGELENLLANVKLYDENIRKELYTDSLTQIPQTPAESRQDDLRLAA